MEKDALLTSALATAAYVTVDDTGARHQGQNRYVTHIGNRDFAWFQSTAGKNRINFLQLLCAGDTGYRINEAALLYMRQQGLPHARALALEGSRRHFFSNTLAWEAHLKDFISLRRKPLLLRNVQTAFETAMTKIASWGSPWTVPLFVLCRCTGARGCRDHAYAQGHIPTGEQTTKPLPRTPPVQK